MPITIPVPDKSAGDVLTESNWDQHIRDNINKLLERGHRVLSVAQFGALTGLEDGDEVYLEVDAANGIMWHLRYVAAETTYKWRFLGGPPMSGLVATSEATASASFVALTTPGPSIALPRSGDYVVAVGYVGNNNGTSGTNLMSYDIGGTSAVDADAAQVPAGTGAGFFRKVKTALGSVTLTSKYRTAAGASHNFFNRTMSVKPVRIRHDA